MKACRDRLYRKEGLLGDILRFTGISPAEKLSFSSPKTKAVLSDRFLLRFSLFNGRAAIDLQPKVAIYYGNRAAASFMLGKYKEALEDSLTSIKLDPSYGRGYQRAGKAYLTLGRSAEV